MSDKAFVDTNILMYAHDASTGIKHERARALVEDLWRSGNGVISTQVLQELCVNLRRKTAKPVSASVARDIVTDYLAWDVQVNDAESVLDALNVQSASNFRSGTHSSFRLRSAPAFQFCTRRTSPMGSAMANFAWSTR